MRPSSGDGRIRVILADDDPSMRAALYDVIADERSLEVVAAAANGRDAVALAARWKPDVALLDVRMPNGGGVQAARRMRQVSPRTAVVALSANGDRDSVVGMVEAGAVGYVVKGGPAAEVIDSIHLAANHESVLSNEAAAHVVGELSAKLQLDRHIAAERQRRLARIRRAVAGKGVSVVFQPIVDLPTRAPFAHEALARFAGPPARPPDQWFAEAAETGQLVDLDLRMVRTAIDAFTDMRSDALLSVNVCPETLASSALIEDLERLPRDQLSRLVLEITEHAPISDYDAVIHHIGRLRARGARLAVDDAGAGFASLTHILRLAPDFIKLDMSITRQVDREDSVRALATALVGFARETRATIIAEGIETPSQLQALQELGITYGQGYLLGRPGDLLEATGGQR